MLFSRMPFSYTKSSVLTMYKRGSYTKEHHRWSGQTWGKWHSIPINAFTSTEGSLVGVPSQKALVCIEQFQTISRDPLTIKGQCALQSQRNTAPLVDANTTDLEAQQRETKSIAPPIVDRLKPPSMKKLSNIRQRSISATMAVSQSRERSPCDS